LGIIIHAYNGLAEHGCSEATGRDHGCGLLLVFRNLVSPALSRSNQRF